MDVIVNANLSRICFSIWPPAAVNILYFLVHPIDGLGGGYRRNTFLVSNLITGGPHRYVTVLVTSTPTLRGALI